MTNSIITNIQKYSINDGDGIRTTIFFKGCPLRCIWCHNPETWDFEEQLLYNAEKCTGCGRCFDKCPQNAICEKGGRLAHDFAKCKACGSCADSCLSGAKEICGKGFSNLDLFGIIKQDVPFYEQSGGGVTLSGGEVMSHDIEFLTELVKKCHKFGISVNIDTCGFVKYDKFKQIMPYVDTFLYDLKLMDSKRHKEFTGEDNALILENLKKLSADGAKLHIRIPLIEGINCDDEHINATIEFLKQINVHKITLLPFHSIGVAKYERVGRLNSDVPMKAPNEAGLSRIRDMFAKNNFNIMCEGLS